MTYEIIGINAILLILCVLSYKVLKIEKCLKKQKSNFDNIRTEFLEKIYSIETRNYLNDYCEKLNDKTIDEIFHYRDVAKKYHSDKHINLIDNFLQNKFGGK